MKILKYVLILIALAAIVFSIYVAVQPSGYSLSRSAEINAPSAVVHQYIDDYTKSYDWSPWLYLEPEAEITYGEKTYGAGAYYAWKGEILGEGSITTLYASKDSISRVLEFIKPYESSADVYWTIEPLESTTKVTWGMKGEMNFMAKLTAVFQGGMDKMMGPDYEKGLRRLDSVVTTHIKKYSISNDGVVAHDGSHYLYIKTSCTMDEMDGKMKAMISELQAFMQNNTIEMTGKLFTRYEKWDEEAGATTFSACFPVKEKIVLPKGSNVLYAYMEPYKYHKTTLKGDYVNLKKAWEKAAEATGEPIEDEQMHGRYPLEVYINGPEETPNPAEWITEIYIPVNQ